WVLHRPNTIPVLERIRDGLSRGVQRSVHPTRRDERTHQTRPHLNRKSLEIRSADRPVHVLPRPLDHQTSRSRTNESRETSRYLLALPPAPQHRRSGTLARRVTTDSPKSPSEPAAMPPLQPTSTIPSTRHATSSSINFAFQAALPGDASAHLIRFDRG